MFVHPPEGIYFFFRGTVELEERNEICSSIKLFLNKPIYLEEYTVFFSRTCNFDTDVSLTH
jgi:hypothetical protein